jgi:uncharacterized OsmC-like protein
VSNAIRDAVTAAETYLKEHPDEARYTDNEARAALTGGLAVTVTSPEGFSVSTDMTRSVGGGGTGPSPGWLLRAAQASCLATFIALRAARQGLDVTGVEVIVDSESDDRGTLGLDDSLPAGPMSSRARVHIESAAPRDQLEAVVRWADTHCPVQDAVRRPVETRLEIT